MVAPLTVNKSEPDNARYSGEILVSANCNPSSPLLVRRPRDTNCPAHPNIHNRHTRSQSALMSDEASSGPPKTPRAKHRHSKSAVSMPAAGGRQTNQLQHRSNRRHHEHRQTQVTPEWNDAVPSQDSTGDFDSDGNYVSAPITGPAESADIDSPSDKGLIGNSSQRNRRKPRARKESEQNATSQTVPNDTTSPPGKASNQGQDGNGTVLAAAFTPAKSTAYAGPTFHASPAASSLSIPKFFSKSVPAATSQSSLQARLEKEEDTSDKSESPPQEAAKPFVATSSTSTGSAVTRNTDSPLDFFFKADREEKSKANGTTVSSTPKSKITSRLPQSEPAPVNHWFSIYGGDQKSHTRHDSSGSGKDLFMMELDGNSAPTRNSGVSYFDRVAPTQSIPPPPSLLHQQSDPYLAQYSAGHNIYASPNYGKSMPSLAGEAANSAHELSPFYRPQGSPTPRSTGSTPAPPSNSPYHYGNRNLSPLFQAAKNDPVRRSSNLRQELKSDVTPELPGSPLPDRFQKNPSKSPKDLDASAVALDYLRAHVSQQTHMPDTNISRLVNAGENPVTTNPHTTPYIHSQPPDSVVAGQPPAVSSIRNQNANVKSMEDDLRRLLNLSAFDGNGTQ